jgi:uncharacterized phage protein gp47/JayE
MPWVTPSLKQVRELVRDDITTALTGAAVVGNTVLRVMADAQAGLARLILKYLDWLALQLLPDTAEHEWLSRHGDIWLQNLDGSIGRKGAALATGTVGFSGTAGVVIPAGTVVVAATGDTYETLDFLTLPDITLQPAEVAVRALNPGASGNQPTGSFLSPNVPMTGVSADVIVIDLRGGLDVETDEALRARVLERIKKPPMGGDADDYVAWAMSIPSVTRAFCAPRGMGPGTITLRFMVDALRPETGGFPTEQDIDVVTAYLDKVRPVAVKDFWVMAPVPEYINMGITLANDSLNLRNQVTVAVKAMIDEKAAPAHAVDGTLVGPTTIESSWISEAIGRVTQDFDLDFEDYPMPHNGSLAVLGTITWPVP